MASASRRVEEDPQVRNEVKRLGGRKVTLHWNTILITDKLR
jgi:hypothetical protein